MTIISFYRLEIKVLRVTCSWPQVSPRWSWGLNTPNHWPAEPAFLPPELWAVLLAVHPGGIQPTRSCRGEAGGCHTGGGVTQAGAGHRLGQRTLVGE